MYILYYRYMYNIIIGLCLQCSLKISYFDLQIGS